MLRKGRIEWRRARHSVFSADSQYAHRARPDRFRSLLAGRRLRLPAETSFFAEIDLRDVLGAALLAEPVNPALLILPTSAQRADTSLSPWLLPCALSDSAFPHVIRVAAAEVLLVGPD